MDRKPTYEELEQRVKELEKEVAECDRAEGEISIISLNDHSLGIGYSNPIDHAFKYIFQLLPCC